MGGIVLGGSLCIGIILVIGQRFFPDYIVMWFASSDNTMAVWRDLVIILLLALLILREYFKNQYLKLIWSSIGIGLVWGGISWFIDHPEYIFDTILLCSAGITFLLSALEPLDEQVTIDYWRWVGQVRGLVIALSRTIGSALPTMQTYRTTGFPEQLASWRYISDAGSITHRLQVRDHLSRPAHNRWG